MDALDNLYDEFVDKLNGRHLPSMLRSGSDSSFVRYVSIFYGIDTALTWRRVGNYSAGPQVEAKWKMLNHRSDEKLTMLLLKYK